MRIIEIKKHKSIAPGSNNVFFYSFDECASNYRQDPASSSFFNNNLRVVERRSIELSDEQYEVFTKPGLSPTRLSGFLSHLWHYTGSELKDDVYIEKDI